MRQSIFYQVLHTKTCRGGTFRNSKNIPISDNHFANRVLRRRKLTLVVSEGLIIKDLWNQETNSNKELRSLHHLNSEDLFPDNFEKMAVGFAVRFFSIKTAAARTRIFAMQNFTKLSRSRLTQPLIVLRVITNHAESVVLVMFQHLKIHRRSMCFFLRHRYLCYNIFASILLVTIDELKIITLGTIQPFYDLGERKEGLLRHFRAANIPDEIYGSWFIPMQ